MLLLFGLVNPTIEVTPVGLKFIKDHEGCPTRRINGEIRAVPYLDVAGYPTLGYGRRISWDEYRRLKNVGISLKEADQNFTDDVTRFSKNVKKLISVPVTPNQFDALVSFTYNVGIGAFRKSTLRKKLNKQDYVGAANEFPRWVYSKGKKRAGLINRRRHEKEMFLGE